MNFRFVTKTVHAYLDYPVALSLMITPFLLGIGRSNPVALWLSLATGVAAFALTFLTDHETGVIRVLSYWLHVAVDRIVARCSWSRFSCSASRAWTPFTTGPTARPRSSSPSC